MSMATTLPGMPDGLVFLEDKAGGKYAFSALRDHDGNALVWRVSCPRKLGSDVWAIVAHRTLAVHLRQKLYHSMDRCIEECNRAEQIARSEHARRASCPT